MSSDFRGYKKNDDQIKVIWGGPNASINADELIKHECIDYVVAGEGEHAIIHILENLDSDSIDFPGIYYKRNGQLVINEKRQRIENLDLIPFPARDLLKWNGYGLKSLYLEGRPWTKRKRVAAIATSRGCPFDCVFCASRKMWGQVWKGRSPENVVVEIKHLYAEYNVKEFHFYDDNASLSKKRLLQLCHSIRNNGLDISLAAPNGLFIGSLDHELLAALASAGFYRITLPIETGCEKTRKHIGGKPLNFNHVKNVVDSCNELGIWVHANFIIGFPEETLEDVEETIKFACSLDIDSCVFFIAQPLPHTRLTELFRHIGSLRKTEEVKENSFYRSRYNTKYFTSEELNQLRNQAQKQFKRARLYRLLFKPNYTLSVIKKVLKNGSLIFYSVLKKVFRSLRY